MINSISSPHDPDFILPTNTFGKYGEYSCEVYLFLRAAYHSQFWGVVLMVQKQGQVSLDEMVSAVGEGILYEKFWRKGFIGVKAEKLLWIEYYPADRVSPFSRMERVGFKKHPECVKNKLDCFFDPIWHKTTTGLVEKLMGLTWIEMGLPEVKRHEIL